MVNMKGEISPVTAGIVIVLVIALIFGVMAFRNKQQNSGAINPVGVPAGAQIPGGAPGQVAPPGAMPAQPTAAPAAPAAP